MKKRIIRFVSILLTYIAGIIAVVLLESLPVIYSIIFIIIAMLSVVWFLSE